MKKVVMEQTSNYRWRLVSPSGHVMVDDKDFASAKDAEDWVIAYISSFNDWSYEMRPRRRDEQDSLRRRE